MSDTPRTNNETGVGQGKAGRCYVSINFARQLERELAETATELQTLRTANAGLIEKVQRLQEAGDGLICNPQEEDIERWNQAKGQP